MPSERVVALRWIPVWQRNMLVWVKLAGPAIFGNFGEPLLYMLALGYGLGAFVQGMSELPYPVFLASGLVCSSAMSTSSFEGMYSAYTRMAVQNTWGAMLATPISVSDVVIGETAWAATKSLISSSAILLVAAFLGAVSGLEALLVLPVVVLIGLCFGAMALVVTAVSRSYDFFLYYTTLFITPSLLIGGVFFPLERMPEAIQWLAAALPLTHAVNVVRPLMTGLPLQDVALHLTVVMTYTVVALVLAIRLIARRLSA
jgi:lipooligosaccharide transport system permease protein